MSIEQFIGIVSTHFIVMKYFYRRYSINPESLSGFIKNKSKPAVLIVKRSCILNA
jgi:hypothetical protein